MIRRAIEKDIPKIIDLLGQVCLVHHNGRPDIFKVGTKYSREELLTVGGATLVISLSSGFKAAAAKSPEMGVSAMAISMVVVPLVSLLTRKKDTDERVEEIFECYNEK